MMSKIDRDYIWTIKEAPTKQEPKSKMGKRNEQLTQEESS